VRVGLIGRLVIGGLVIAVFFLVQLLQSQRSLSTIRHSTRDEQRAEEAIVAAIGIEQRVIDVSSAARGFVITHDPAYRRSWQAASAKLPRESAHLRALQPGPSTARIEDAWRSYVSDYSAPVMRLAVTDPARARARIATLEGVRRIARVRGLIDPFVTEENAVVTRDRARVSRAEHGAQVIAVAGAVIRVVLFLAVLIYLLRALVGPIRRLAAATGDVARTGRSVTVPEGGAGEVGDLTRSFNEMSRSIQQSRQALETQNEDLERLANVLRAVLDSTVDGILLSDADGNVQLANRPVINLTRDLGMTFDGPVVDRLLSVQHRIRDQDQYREAMERLRTNPDQPTFDEFEDTVSGRVFQGFTSPVRDDRGGFLGRIWTLREVTQQRELDQLKDDFVATVSHELRTPLTSMMGFLEMLREGEAGPLNADQEKFLAIVYRSSERLQRLVGDLLFVARLDVSGLQMQFGEVPVQEVAADVAESSAAVARARQIDLRTELGEAPPVWGDRERLGQLVTNLASNAIKFTPAGGTVTIRVLRDGDDVVVEVEDTGIGIPQAEQDRVFQRFFRSTTATAQAIPGTGLGLVITKAIAEAHGGSISLHSEPGAGTCFRVRLPIDGRAAE
jgi:signal transduction histidine kinase